MIGAISMNRVFIGDINDSLINNVSAPDKCPEVAQVA